MQELHISSQQHTQTGQVAATSNATPEQAVHYLCRGPPVAPAPPCLAGPYTPRRACRPARDAARWQPRGALARGPQCHAAHRPRAP